jgi:hypothetical protein
MKHFDTVKKALEVGVVAAGLLMAQPGEKAHARTVELSAVEIADANKVLAAVEDKYLQIFKVPIGLKVQPMATKNITVLITRMNGETFKREVPSTGEPVYKILEKLSVLWLRKQVLAETFGIQSDTRFTVQRETADGVGRSTKVFISQDAQVTIMTVPGAQLDAAKGLLKVAGASIDLAGMKTPNEEVEIRAMGNTEDPALYMCYTEKAPQGGVYKNGIVVNLKNPSSTLARKMTPEEFAKECK